MINVEDHFSPRWVSPPGETIWDLLKSKGMSREQFASEAGLALRSVDDLLAGKCELSKQKASVISRLLGASPDFWLQREFDYRSDLRRLMDGADEWLSALPVSDMVKFGWIQKAASKLEKLLNCLDFFDVSDIPAWHASYNNLLSGIAYKTSRSFDANPVSVATWLRQGELAAQKIGCAQWSKKALIAALGEIRKLTKTGGPEDFLPALQRICASCGVATVVVRSPTGCRASGATRFLDKKRALIQLSARYLTEDHFWFAFFHEAAHLILHDEQHLFIETSGSPLPLLEEEADAYASSVLIPNNRLNELDKLPKTKMAIARFAKDVGISVGLVVGQMQRRGLIPHNHFNALKRRYSWAFSTLASLETE